LRGFAEQLGDVHQPDLDVETSGVPGWMVAYGAAAAAAIAAIPLHLLLSSDVSVISTGLFVAFAAMVFPVWLARAGHITMRASESAVLAHQVLLLAIVMIATPVQMVAILLPAMIGVLAFGTRLGSSSLMVLAGLLMAMMAMHQGMAANGLIAMADLVTLSGLMAAAGVATLITDHWSHRNAETGTAAQDGSSIDAKDNLNPEQRILQAMPQLVLLHNRTGNVTEVYGQGLNPVLARDNGWLGGGLFARVHVADRPALLHTMDKARHEAGIHSASIRISDTVVQSEPQSPSSSGQAPSYRWVEFRTQREFAAAEQDGYPNLCSILRDIQSEREREEALQEARAQAERSNIEKTRFLASVSHELRTPLNAIIGFSELLKLRQTEVEPGPMSCDKRIEYASLISDSGQHLLDVVNGILDVTKMEAGRFEIQCEGVAVRPIASSAIDMLGTGLSKEGPKVALKCADDLPEIVADGRALKQVFLNLVSNAVKFSPDGDPVEVCIGRDANHLKITVSDRGIGIAQQDLDRIGEPFFRTADAECLQTPGTGLGLSIVRGLVDLHGGQLTVHSTVGQGTQVQVHLPIAGPGTGTQHTDSNEKITTLPQRHPAQPSETAPLKRLKKAG
jgi:cell cycle sensor histidine kinase DivJ